MKEGHLIGARLRALRVPTGVHMRDVAKAARCSYRTLQMIEKHGRQPSGELLSRILRVLGDLHGREIQRDEVVTYTDAQVAA